MSKKISEMVSASSFTGTDVVPIVDSGLDNKKVTGNQIKTFCTSELNDELGVTFVHDNNVTTVAISGVLSTVGTYIKSHFVTNRWITFRVSPTDNTGYYGDASFVVLSNCMSTNFGIAILCSENYSRSDIVVGHMISGTWNWKAITGTTIT